MELIDRAAGYSDHIAIVTGDQSLSYSDLLTRSAGVASCLLAGADDLGEERIAFYLPGSIDYALVMWGIWRAGGVAVPLNIAASTADLEHVFATTGVARLIVGDGAPAHIHELCDRMNVAVLRVADLGGSPVALPGIAPDRRAMILFTSGTTSKPKGVVTTHANITAQVRTLIDAWGWGEDDSIPLFLPMHHVHGIINVLSCALWAGARVETFEKFEASSICARVADGAYSLFMAVPTIYVKLIDYLNGLQVAERQRICDGFRAMRLMISGSAALPVKIHEDWQALTGQVLLERYGMTEIGMAISNPLNGERRPGAVGMPLPGVEVILAGEDGGVLDGENNPGEIWVRGPNVFSEYWRNSAATEDSFTDGWFRTGDMAVRERGYYRIMGRLSMDIIKSGGEKLSALEIEDVLLTHPDIAECAVVGAPDDTWGEAVCAAIVPAEGASVDEASIRAWGKDRMTHYKVPKRVMIQASLPRNAMGKVTKTQVKALFS